MSTTTNTPLTERIALFEQAATYVLETLAEVSPTDLDRPTPCEGWDVRAVVLHLADVADAVIDLTATGELAMPTPRGMDTPNPVAVARQRIRALEERLTTLSARAEQVDVLLAAAQGGANELATHGWDLATALGSARPIPDDTATALLALVEGNLDDAARGTNFAPVVPIPPPPPRATVSWPTSAGAHPDNARPPTAAEAPDSTS
jgi:uncharacterized protein (TIGR03086 family)